jgi:hypothetical protein
MGSKDDDASMSLVFPENFGFRAVCTGTHTSRTMMSSELMTLLASTPKDASRAQYAHAVIEDNILGKKTLSTRKLAFQRLSELYSFKTTDPVFRALRHLWFHDQREGHILAMLCSLTRDPLLRASAEPVLATAIGHELSRQAVTDSIRLEAGHRLNPATLDKVVRNTSSSWSQSGHLNGRVRKFRQVIQPGVTAVTYAILLGYLQGHRGQSLFNTLWTRVLDAPLHELRRLAADAKRLGYLDLKTAGEIIEISFPSLLTNQEIKESRGSN